MTTEGQTPFHPYKVIHQGRSTLQLQPVTSQTVGVIILRIMPLVMLAIGVVMFITQKQILFLAVFGGIALVELFIFSFIKIPAAISMDSMGFTLETLSIKGKKETYYLWNDVDFIRHRLISAKNSTSLSYEAVLKSGKKLVFLSIPNYQTKKISIPEINAVITQISSKQIAAKE